MYLTAGSTRKFIPHRGTGRVGLMEPFPKVFDMLQYYISKRFCIQWKTFNLLNKMR